MIELFHRQLKGSFWAHLVGSRVDVNTAAHFPCHQDGSKSRFEGLSLGSCLQYGFSPGSPCVYAPWVIFRSCLLCDSSHAVYIPSALNTAKCILLCKEGHQACLKLPYLGPFWGLWCRTIDMNVNVETFTVDCWSQQGSSRQGSTCPPAPGLPLRCFLGSPEGVGIRKVVYTLLWCHLTQSSSNFSHTQR